ncbi:MAG: AMP-binding protein [Propioniciclava sp.]|uniref:AMP-binding protein n=1 Tax=Propioniciclava sp. TaxID=2038686 RepID=UPI0039E6250C
MQLSYGPGGTGADAVARLYDALEARLARRLGELQDGECSEVPLLMATDGAEFEASRGRITQPLDGVDVIIRTSGSTDGHGRLVGLSWDALVASARATLTRLGGPGQWVTSLPVHGVAGFQVVLRSVLAGVRPVVFAPGGGFDAALFARCAAALDPGVRHYLSLVPTQLHRALDAAPRALAGFDAVLVGGAALAPGLAARATDAGVRIVTSYGATETCGGCVYDGVPLDGVEIELIDGLIHLAGPTLATRYLDTAEQPFVIRDGRRLLATHDLGAWRGQGRLIVRGRADDVIISGGVNVNPHEVEAALAVLGGEWVVVGVPDDEWGQRVVAVGTASATPAEVRAATAQLPPAARPRGVVHVGALPVGRTGKVDRRAVAGLAAQG